MLARTLRATIGLLLAPVLSGCGLLHAGLFSSITPTQNECHSIDGFVGGTEDIAVDHERRRIYISADDRRSENPAAGAIYTMSFDEVLQGGSPTRVTSADLPAFHPHGIGLWVHGDERRLFVINHIDRENSQIDIFDVNGAGQLTHLRTMPTTSLLYRPNDIAPVGPTSFYATNDRGAPYGPNGSVSFAEYLEIIFGLDNASVIYVDESGSQQAAPGLDYANGIVASPDGQVIYVSETSEGAVRRYRRLPNNDLQLERRLRVGVGPDNLVLGADDRIWIAAHDRFLAFLRHRADEREPSPSRAFTVSPEWSVEANFFQTEGNDLSAISVAAPVEDRIVLGAVFQPELLVCRRPVQ